MGIYPLTLSLELNQIYLGDCLELMRDIPDKSIDMILCDLPYGTTACKWDTIIPFELLWEQYKRIIKDNGAIILTGQEPFSSHLRLSNITMYKYDWVWEKSNPTGMGQANKKPMKYHELISVFYKKQPTYNKQMIVRESSRIKDAHKSNYKFNVSDLTTGNQQCKSYKDIDSKRYDPNFKNPSSIIKINSLRANSKEWCSHPTQKPVALFEYLIKTYTNESEIILDNCIGSGTTAIACINTGRNFIGIEKDEKYCEIAKNRVLQHSNTNVSTDE